MMVQIEGNAFVCFLLNTIDIMMESGNDYVEGMIYKVLEEYLSLYFWLIYIYLFVFDF